MIVPLLIALFLVIAVTCYVSGFAAGRKVANEAWREASWNAWVRLGKLSDAHYDAMLVKILEQVQDDAA